MHMPSCDIALTSTAKMDHICFFAVVSFVITLGGCTENIILQLNDGQISGKTATTVNGRQIFAFKNIPYAKPPIGELRFKRPQRPDKWEGVLDATDDGPLCPQQDFLTAQYYGDEDCLHLNVYTPKLPTSGENPKFPVMFWIHGGGYAIGTGNELLYGPNRLLDKDVILVSINYRLGVFGFLSTDDEVIAGNYGLFDQNLALRWVQENIVVFGGDPGKVTIFGSSAGGGSTSMHTLSPHSKGLFHAAILQSGSANCRWATQPNPRKIAKVIAIKLGCSAYNSETIRKCLLTKKAEDIIAIQSTLSLAIFLPVILAPVLEKNDAFFPANPKDLLQTGKFHKVPIMIGRTSGEGALDYPSILTMFDETSPEFWDQDMEIILPLFNVDAPNNLTNIAKEIRQHLTSHISLNDKVAAREAAKTLYDALRFAECIDSSAKSYRSAGNPTFAYELSYRGLHSFTELSGIEEDIGVCHGDDLQYLFEGAYFPKSLTTEEDLAMSDLMVSLWTSFAINHDPTPKGSSSFKWDRTTSGVLEYLDITSSPKMVRRDFNNPGQLYGKELPSILGQVNRIKNEL